MRLRLHAIDPKRLNFLSDTHLGHKNLVLRHRKAFASIEEHDEHIIRAINERVGKKDILIHAGDFVFGNRQRIIDFRRRLNVEVSFLALGNHDEENIAFYQTIFAGVAQRFDITVSKNPYERQYIVVDHYPKLVWNKSHHGSWMVHGHCHNSLPDDPHARRIDVAVDANYGYPFNYVDIEAYMSTKDYRPVDYHGREVEGEHSAV